MFSAISAKHSEETVTLYYLWFSCFCFVLFDFIKSYFNICWKIYSQIDFKLSRVKLQSKVPDGKETSLRVSGVSSYRGLS